MKCFQYIFPWVSKARFFFFVLALPCWLLLFIIALLTEWKALLGVGMLGLIWGLFYYLLVDEIYIDQDYFYFRKRRRVVKIEKEKIASIKIGLLDNLSFQIIPKPGRHIPLQHRYLLTLFRSLQEEYWPMKQDLRDAFSEEK